MLNPNLELLKSVLQPLLEDFQYWFGRALLSQTQQLSFLTTNQQSDLLGRVKQAQQEVSTDAV